MQREARAAASDPAGGRGEKVRHGPQMELRTAPRHRLGALSVIRVFHILATWALIVLGLVGGACCAALWSPIAGVMGAIIDLLVGMVCAWIGWRIAGAPTLHAPLEEVRVRWDALGEAGLWRGEGCALGAVHRHAWSSWNTPLQMIPNTLYHPRGHRLMLGASADDTFFAAASAWRHALIYVDTRGTSDRLDRDDVVRFGPGRIDSARINPLLMIRRGPHAWRDAYILASGLLGASASGDAVATLAAVLLDHLHTAALEDRTLGGLRRRLLDRETTLTALVHAVHEKGRDGAWRSDPEIARLMRFWRSDPAMARLHLATAAQALACFQDGRLAEATAALDLRLADAASVGPRTIILEAPPGDVVRYGPFFAALLGQLISQLTDAVETDVFGRRKTTRVLLTIDDPALIGAIPLLAQRGAVAPRCGLELLVRSEGVQRAVALFGEGRSLDAYSAVAAIGPLRADISEILSAHAGTRSVVRLRQAQADWRRRLLPVVDLAQLPRLSVSKVTRAADSEVSIVIAKCGLIRGRALPAPTGCLSLSTEVRTPPPHDWTGAAAPAPAIEGRPLPEETTPASLPLFEGAEDGEPADGGPGPAQGCSRIVGKKLRAGLARGARRT